MPCFVISCTSVCSTKCFSLAGSSHSQGEPEGVRGMLTTSRHQGGFHCLDSLVYNYIRLPLSGAGARPIFFVRHYFLRPTPTWTPITYPNTRPTYEYSVTHIRVQRTAWHILAGYLATSRKRKLSHRVRKEQAAGSSAPCLQGGVPI